MQLLNFCTDQQDDEKTVFNAKSQRCQDAEENQQIFAPLRLGIFALKVSPSTWSRHFLYICLPLASSILPADVGASNLENSPVREIFHEYWSGG